MQTLFQNYFIYIIQLQLAFLPNGMKEMSIHLEITSLVLDALITSVPGVSTKKIQILGSGKMVDNALQVASAAWKDVTLIHHVAVSNVVLIKIYRMAQFCMATAPGGKLVSVKLQQNSRLILPTSSGPAINNVSRKHNISTLVKRAGYS